MRKTGTRLAAAVVVALLALIWLSCGNEFRPVATPVFPGGPDPQGQRQAVSVNNTGGAIGSTTNINVSGDTVVASHTVGKGPVHAGTTPSGARIFVVNLGDDTVSTYLTLLASSAPVTISLPAGSAPVFAHSTQSTRMYVANSRTGTVGVIDANTSVLTDLIAVGNNPVALAELPSGAKLYCVNQNGNTVSVISTVDKVVLTTISVNIGNMPSFAVSNDTGAFVFVANSGSNTVSVIDTTTDIVTAVLPVGVAPNFLFFDNSLKRVYVTNSGDGTVSIIRTDVNPAANPPVTVTVGTAPLSVTALADGSRAYVANSGSGTVSVITTSNNTVSRTITVGTNPVSIASSSDSSKVYVANRGSNTISIIRTTDDTVVSNAPPTSTQPVWVLTVP
ncbi:MAG TPA: YncE family protein [Terriglobales bacterium]|nr:YncE family protein [Terriglobales bacterium]